MANANQSFVNSFVNQSSAAVNESFTAMTQSLGDVTSERAAVQALSNHPRFTIRPGTLPRLQDEERIPSQARAPFFSSRASKALLLVLYLYFDSSVAILQQVYKEYRVDTGIGSPGCAPIQACLDGETIGICAVEEVEMTDRRMVGIGGADATAVGGAAVSDDGQLEETAEVKREERDCPWYIVRRVKPGEKWHKRPQTFTKGVALSFQASVGLTVYYCFNFWKGGYAQLKLCWEPRRLLRFGVVGCTFGLGAVFSFLAQDSLEPASYALYAQSGIIVIPILWRVVFRKSLAEVTWIHIILIGIGIVMYRLSDLNDSTASSSLSGRGLFWIGMKVLSTSFASIFAELFLKGEDDVPFSVQASCILPWKILSTFSTIYLLPPHGLPDRPGGFFHDWTPLVIVIIFHNLGDTIFNAVVAKTFDSVIKAICSVVGIICPTMMVSLMVGWDKFDFITAGGQLKFTGSVVVVISSFAYVFGRSMHAAKDNLAEKLKAAELALSEMQTGQSNNTSRHARVSSSAADVELSAGAS